MKQQTEDEQKAAKAPPSKQPKQHHVSPDSDDNQLTVCSTRSSSNLMYINMKLSEDLPGTLPNENGEAKGWPSNQIFQWKPLTMPFQNSATMSNLYF